MWVAVQEQMEQPVPTAMFFRAFRMPPARFFELVDIIRPHIRHAQCPAAQFVGVCVYRLAQNYPVWHVAEEFDVSEGTVFNYTSEFVSIMTSMPVRSSLMQVPTGQALVDTMQDLGYGAGCLMLQGLLTGKSSNSAMPQTADSTLLSIGLCDISPRHAMG